MLLIPANIFQPLIDVFEAVLKFFHDSVGVSWGWSIVLLTIAVRALLLPLAVKQFHSMQKLQRLGPELKVIQNKYKEDKQRQQQEVMKFYKENEVNPFASCLPLVAQIPVFIGLFYMLRTTLRKDICPGVQVAYQVHHGHGATTPCGAGHGAGFLFIPDLTRRRTAPARPADSAGCGGACGRLSSQRPRWRPSRAVRHPRHRRRERRRSAPGAGASGERGGRDESGRGVRARAARGDHPR